MLLSIVQTFSLFSSFLFFCTLLPQRHVIDAQGLAPDESGCAWYRQQSFSKKCKKLSFLYKWYCRADFDRDCKGKGPKPTETPEDQELVDPTPIDEGEPYVEPVDNSVPAAAVEPNEIYKECCEANGVPPECMGLCSYTNKDWRILCFREAMCENYLKVMAYCGPNGNDNSECCKEKMYAGVGCYRFCDGKRRFPALYEFFRIVGTTHVNGNCLKEMDQFNACNLKTHSGAKDWDTHRWKDEKFSDLMEGHMYRTCPNATVLRDLGKKQPEFKLLAEPAQ